MKTNHFTASLIRGIEKFKAEYPAELFSGIDTNYENKTDEQIMNINVDMQRAILKTKDERFERVASAMIDEVLPKVFAENKQRI
jgi:hypothetical protein